MKLKITILTVFLAFLFGILINIVIVSAIIIGKIFILSVPLV